MDNTDDPTTGGVDASGGQETTQVTDPELTPTPPASTETPATTNAGDNVEAIAKRVADYMKEESAVHLTLDGGKQVSDVDKAYGRR